MEQKRPFYKRLFFIAIVLIVLGVTMTNILKDSLKYFGIILIALGALFFIVAMRKRKGN